MRRLLLVDDEATLRRLFILALRRTPWTVDEAESAERALERFRERPYNLLVVDKNLPGRSGVELVRDIRADDPDTPIIVMTGHSTADSATELLNLGVSAFLEKPFPDVNAVVRVIEQVTTRPRAPSVTRSAALATAHFRRATQALTEQQLPMVVVTPDGPLRTWLRNTYGGRTITSFSAALEEGLAQVTSAAPPLCLVDSGLADDLAPWVERCRGASPETVVAVVGARPSLSAITALIGAGARALLPSPLEDAGAAAKLEELVENVRQARARRDVMLAGA